MDIEEAKKRKQLAISLANMISEYYSLDLDTKNANIKLKKTSRSSLFNIDFYVFIWNGKESSVPAMFVKHFSDYITNGQFNINVNISHLQELKRIFESHKPD